MYDCEFVDHFRFFILEHVSDEDVVDESETNNEDVQHSSLAKNRFSDENRQLRENHDLFRHFFLKFFVRVNLISVVCRSARREFECRFSTESCSNQF